MDLRWDDGSTAMPRDTQLCDLLGAPVQTHAMYGHRVDGRRVGQTLEVEAIRSSVTMGLLHVVLFGVSIR